MDYGRQASGGRVDPSRIDPLVAAKPEVADPASVLKSVAEAANPSEALRGFNPPHKGYALLRAKLAELRQTSDMAERGPIPYGPALKPGMRDARVPLVRARFGLDIAASDAREDHLVYDTQVAGAVADYQRHHGLPASGVLTSRTIASLSGGNPKRLESEIVANMERWRWLPRDLGDSYIAVNIPDFSLDVVKGDTVVHHARVVVGKPDHQTPVFSEAMKFIIVNPYWNVPLSIVKKEMLPKLAADPNYFANHGYETVERNGETFVRQPPGRQQCPWANQVHVPRTGFPSICTTPTREGSSPGTNGLSAMAAFGSINRSSWRRSSSDGTADGARHASRRWWAATNAPSCFRPPCRST